MEHTKTPWKYSGQNAAEIYGYRGFYEDRPQTVAIVKGYWDGEAQANAEFILRACNSHDELLEVCKWLRQVLDTEKYSILASKADAAIAKATGKEE